MPISVAAVESTRVQKDGHHPIMGRNARKRIKGTNGDDAYGGHKLNPETGNNDLNVTGKGKKALF
jgi:hypothetical protein